MHSAVHKKLVPSAPWQLIGAVPDVHHGVSQRGFKVFRLYDERIVHCVTTAVSRQDVHLKADHVVAVVLKVRLQSVQHSRDNDNEWVTALVSGGQGDEHWGFTGSLLQMMEPLTACTGKLATPVLNAMPVYSVWCMW